ncbi:MAG: alpha/beta hydrolase-fold protein [Bacteroidota bacterium]
MHIYHFWRSLVLKRDRTALLAAWLLLVMLATLQVSCTSSGPQAVTVKLDNGALERYENFNSALIPARNVDVWLPDNYSDEQSYAVLYMHDGQMLFDSTTTWNKQEWGADEVLSELMAQNKIKPTILVGIWNTEFRHSEYFPQKPFSSLPTAYQDSLIERGRRSAEQALFKKEVCSDDYLEFITTELKPFIDERYPTLPDKANTVIAGSSMGGLISMYALCEYPDVFGGAGCLSTHWIGIFDTLNNPIPAAFASYMDEQLPSPSEHKMYFDYGTETLDTYYEPYQMAIDSILVAHGFGATNWITQKFPGADHSERAWRSRLHLPLTFLLRKE